MKKIITATILFSLFFWLCFSVSRTFADEQGDIGYNQLLNEYQKMSENVDAQTQNTGDQQAGEVQMNKLFKLQEQENVLSTFGQTETNVVQGVQDIAEDVARNTKGS